MISGSSPIAAAIMALVVVTMATPAVAGGDQNALERYRPILRYSAQEQYFAQAVSLPPASAEARLGHRVYGHVARQGNDVWLQYWLFYAYNPQDRSPLRTGRHEGDWELVQFRLGPEGVPDLATLSQHSWAEGCDWAELEQESAGAPEAPVLYVANGSHALYSGPDAYDRPFPDPTDEAGGDGLRVRPELTRIGEREPAWVRYPGRWGETEAGWIPGESPSPVGPRFQESGAWRAPTTYHEEVALPCGSGPPGRPWQTPVILLLVAVAGFGLMRYLRAIRSRNRLHLGDSRRGRTDRYR